MFPPWVLFPPLLASICYLQIGSCSTTQLYLYDGPVGTTSTEYPVTASHCQSLAGPLPPLLSYPPRPPTRQSFRHSQSLSRLALPTRQSHLARRPPTKDKTLAAQRSVAHSSSSPVSGGFAILSEHLSRQSKLSLIGTNETLQTVTTDHPSHLGLANCR